MRFANRLTGRLLRVGFDAEPVFHRFHAPLELRQIFCQAFRLLVSYGPTQVDDSGLHLDLDVARIQVAFRKALADVLADPVIASYVAPRTHSHERRRPVGTGATEGVPTR